MKKIKMAIFEWLWPELKEKFINEQEIKSTQIKNLKEQIKYLEWEIWKIRNK